MSSEKSVFIAPAHIAAISPYQPGKPIDELAREFGLNPDKIVKLASNENPLGMPESAKRAIVAAIDQLGRYPDPAGFDLKRALSERYDIDQAWLTLGNGSNDILELVGLALLEPGSGVVYARHSFAVYRLATQARGAKHVVVPAVNLGHDLPAMLAAIDEATRLVRIPTTRRVLIYLIRRLRIFSPRFRLNTALASLWCWMRPITNFWSRNSV